MKKAQIDQASQYQQRVAEVSPKSPVFKNCFNAFWVGGLICVIGQGVSQLGQMLFQFDKESLSAFTSIVMVFLGATLTGLGVYDRIGKLAGAGSVVPITGFANSIVSPAMEFRREGLVMGMGAKLFTVAGPVLVFGISTSVVVGLIYLAIR